ASAWACSSWATCACRSLLSGFAFNCFCAFCNAMRAVAAAILSCFCSGLRVGILALTRARSGSVATPACCSSASRASRAALAHAGVGGDCLELLLFRSQSRNRVLDPGQIRLRRSAGLLFFRLPRFPGGLVPCCFLGASKTIVLPLFCLALQAFQTLLVTHAGLL